MVGQCLDNGKKWERTAAHNLSTVLLAGQDVCEDSIEVGALVIHMFNSMCSGLRGLN